jgi:hypothetical protein
LCNLEVPDAETFIGILNGLDGLPAVVNTVEAGLFTTCSRVDTLIPQTITIPSWTISILGTNYSVFPGYNARLFSGPVLTC